MADPFLEHCGGWTPAPDILTRNYGFETAYTWGRIRRLCQLGGGTFTASHEAIGDRIGMSRRALIDILKVLIRDGYVEDLTPGVRNRAHTYSIKKGEDKILSGMQISHTEDDIPTENPNPDASDTDVDMRILHSDEMARRGHDAEFAHLDDTGMQNLHTDYAENAQPGMQKLHLKRDSLETSRDSLTPNGVSGKPLGKVGNGPDAKTQIRDKFVELTHIPMPTSRSGIKFWWGNFGEILKLARGDPALACRWEGEAVGYMQSSHLTITSPKSIIGLIGALASGQTLEKARTNGTYQRGNRQTNEQLTGHDFKSRSTVNPFTGEAYLPDGTIRRDINDSS